MTDSLIKCLTDFGQYESEEDAHKREIVLGKLNSILKDFVYKISLKRNQPKSIAEEGLLF